MVIGPCSCYRTNGYQTKSFSRKSVIGLDFWAYVCYNRVVKRTQGAIETRKRTSRKASIMGTKRVVIGQTGTTVLSDEKIQFKLDKKRTVRYRYVRNGSCGYRAEVVGPFHSRLYGACSFGMKRTSAKNALARRLANSYGYIGTMLFSDRDESDTVGLTRVYSDDDRKGGPISNAQLVGSAGR